MPPPSSKYYTLENGRFSQKDQCPFLEAVW